MRGTARRGPLYRVEALRIAWESKGSSTWRDLAAACEVFDLEKSNRQRAWVANIFELQEVRRGGCKEACYSMGSAAGFRPEEMPWSRWARMKRKKSWSDMFDDAAEVQKE